MKKLFFIKYKFYILFGLIILLCSITTSCSWLFGDTKWKVLADYYNLSPNQSAIVKIGSLYNIDNDVKNMGVKYKGKADNDNELISNGTITIRDYISSSSSLYIAYNADHALNTETIFTLTFYDKNNYNVDCEFSLLPKENINREKYLYDITFSISRIEGSSIYSGTGWLLSRIGTTGYTYWLATNEHVTTNWSSSGSLNYRQTWGEWSFSQTFLGYYSANYTKENINNFFPYTGSSGTHNGIDLSILKVNFTNNPNATIKAALDRYNDANGAYGDYLISTTFSGTATERTDLINEINNSFTDGKTNVSVGNASNILAQSSRVIIGGYPHNDNKVRWEYHPTGVTLNSSSQSHTVDDNDMYNDNSTQLAFPQTTSGWMNHGASGSPIMNNDFSIIAIYWGGWTDSAGIIYMPSGSFFGNVFSYGSNQKYLNGTN